MDEEVREVNSGEGLPNPHIRLVNGQSSPYSQKNKRSNKQSVIQLAQGVERHSFYLVTV